MSWALRGQLRTRWWNGTAGFSANVTTHSSASLPGWSKQLRISSSIRPTFHPLWNFIQITFACRLGGNDFLKFIRAWSDMLLGHTCLLLTEIETVPAMLEHFSEAHADFLIKVNLEGKCLSELLREWDINASREISLPGLAVRLVSKLLLIHSRKHRTPLESSTGINTHLSHNWDRACRFF